MVATSEEVAQYLFLKSAERLRPLCVFLNRRIQMFFYFEFLTFSSFLFKAVTI